ncbi:MAG TPA: FAD-dependent monooxygenase [Ktedonobacteraceae bacterium]|nr:FAD-dependent monooxygenase [Ktedonobacteraceae bacterium]
MQNMSLSDVLIVGAGPVGLSLAIDLARRGVHCRIIDQLSAYAYGTRARGVSARTQEIFEDLGVLKALSPYIEPSSRWRFYNRAGQIVREVMPVIGTSSAAIPYPTNLIISQQHTESILREQLETYGLHVELDCRLAGFTQSPDYIVAEIVHAGKVERIQARYLVGCDGGNSTVRKYAGISFLGETYNEEYIMFGNLSVSGLDASYWHFWTDPQEGLLVALNPMPRSDTWFFTASLQPDEDGNLPPPVLETFERTFQERVGMSGVHFFDPIYLSAYRLNIRMVNQYRNGRVFLAGDAAHVHSPAGGQGMNTGIQDAYNLGWKLASVLKGAPDALLETYQSERLPVAQQVLDSTTARTQSWSSSSSTVVQSMADTVQGKDAFADVTQIGIHYRGGRLSRDLDGTTKIRAGDRAPDAPCVRGSDGEHIRLFEAFQGTHFTLLAFSDQPLLQALGRDQENLSIYTILRQGSRTTTASERTLIDEYGSAYAAYGVTENALILVRPDGYIGLTEGDLRQEPIFDYLREVIGR